ncbi:MAG: methionyl-tRNA formyltransferase [Acidimicrobiia bacterium]
MTRVAFLGTPGAAVPTLRALAARHELVLVITQPDRPRGRSGKPAPPPVKSAAEELGLPVLQPGDRDEIRAALASVDGLDLAVVVAYGRLLGPDALAIPARGMLNVHFSLLPRWRGAAPVARALMAGDEMTGISVIRLDEGFDTGPVLTAQAIDIDPEENAGELTSRLAGAGARLLVDVIPAYLSGELEPVAQSDEGMTYAAKIEPAERPLDLGGHAREAVNRVRALAPEPGATLVIDGEPHQVLRARSHPRTPGTGLWARLGGDLVAGFADGGVELVEIWPPGKRAMSGKAWARGRHRDSGTVG